MKNVKTCDICPRNCKIDRGLQNGICSVGNTLRIGRIAPHMWEEPCISGEKGSGAIFFAGCNLKCVYCQNERLSRGIAGQEYSVETLVSEMLKLQEQGVHNINLVTPTHYVPWIVRALGSAKEKGLKIPVVYNTSGYEKKESLKMLEGLVDIYMPDFKYLSPALAEKYSRAKDYPEIVKSALQEMFRQVGTPEFAEDGMMKKGILVRHLVLPGQTDEAKAVVRYLYESFGDNIYISIMNQFTPFGNLEKFPELQRAVSEEEYEDVVNYAIEIGVENGFIQEGGTSSESFIPDFVENNSKVLLE